MTQGFTLGSAVPPLRGQTVLRTLKGWDNVAQGNALESRQPGGTRDTDRRAVRPGAGPPPGRATDRGRGAVSAGPRGRPTPRRGSHQPRGDRGPGGEPGRGRAALPRRD